MKPALQLVSETDSPDSFPWPGTGEQLSIRDAHYRIADMEDRLAGMHKEVEDLARDKVRLERRVAEDEDPLHHAKGSEIVALFARWQQGSGHSKAKLGGPRTKLVKARLKDGYEVTGDGNEADLELAIDGICSHPFASYDRRSPVERSGYKRKDDFELALRDEKHVETLARLGWKARQSGWTPTEGWPK